MKFSLIYEAQTVDDSREGDHQVFAEIVEQALLAEEMGFDTHLGGRAHRLTQVRAHERARDVPRLLAGPHHAHPHRPRRRLPAARR